MSDYLIPPRLGIDDFPKHLQRIYHLAQEDKETSLMAQQQINPSSTSNILNEIDQELAAQTNKEIIMGAAAVASHQSREEQIHALAVKAIDHDEQAKQHAAEAKAAKEQLALIVGHGKHESGNLTISVANAASKFDKAGFEAAFPVEVNPSLYAETLDTSAIPPKLKSQFMIPGEGFGTITVK